MEKQIDDIETVDNEGVKHEKPQMSEEVPVAREDLPSEIPVHSSDDGPVIESDSRDAVRDEVTPENNPERQTELPISQEAPKDVSTPVDETTPDDETNISDSEPRNKSKRKGKEPIYSTTIPPSSESPAGPSTTRPPLPFQLSNNGFYGSRAPSQPLPWELDPERPAQKRPIYFKDAVGREYIIPWRRARTWEGMKMTIDAAFEKIVEGMLNIHVAAGHYDLSFTTATVEEEVVIVSDDPSIIKPAITRAQLPRPLIVHPDFWEDLICPGMAVSMAMWPMEAFIGPNLRGTRPTTTQAGRGMGVGNQAFNNIINVGPPPPPPPGFINIVPPGGRHARRKAKTRVNPGRPVAK